MSCRIASIRSARILRFSASGRENPRSANRFDDERRIRRESPASSLALAPFDQRREAPPRNIEVRAPGLLSLLFECMEDIDGLWVSRNVQNAKSATGADSDFNDSASYRPQRLPVVWQQASLDPIELITDFPSRLVRERTYVLQGGPQPDDRLVGYE
jgi:hypothetical protein